MGMIAQRVCNAHARSASYRRRPSSSNQTPRTARFSRSTALKIPQGRLVSLGAHARRPVSINSYLSSGF